VIVRNSNVHAPVTSVTLTSVTLISKDSRAAVSSYSRDRYIRARRFFTLGRRVGEVRLRLQ
jgi:hypothetical protein